MEAAVLSYAGMGVVAGGLERQTWRRGCVVGGPQEEDELADGEGEATTDVR